MGRHASIVPGRAFALADAAARCVGRDAFRTAVSLVALQEFLADLLTEEERFLSSQIMGESARRIDGSNGTLQ
jgi:hypothetical protein